jgi:hypothetical protein
MADKEVLCQLLETEAYGRSEDDAAQYCRSGVLQSFEFSTDAEMEWLRATAPLTLHLAFSSPGRLMRILGPIVSPSAGAMPMRDPKFARGGVVRSQIVRNQSLRQEAIFLQKLAQEFQRGTLVPFRLFLGIML